MNNFSELSKIITKNISKEDKKKYGIFFTPINCINYNLDILNKYCNLKKIKNILEPSCGSCEYIIKLNKINNKAYITGIEYNKNIYNSIKNIDIFKNKNINIINEDFLKFNTDKKYDLIIGNPPYFVIKKKSIDKKYYEYFDNRPNIFLIFIIKSFTLLNDNGIISFVLPKNFLSCIYYNKLRKYIYENFNILDILEYKKSEYIDTLQETVILIIQKNINNKLNIDKNNSYTLTINNKYKIFGTKDKINELNNLLINTKTLSELGFTVFVGSIPWNQYIERYNVKKKNSIDEIIELTDDKTKTRLIYSSDIVNNKIIIKEHKNEEKKHFINKNGKKGLILIINRGWGKGKYKFIYALVDLKDKEYLLENHVIGIKYNTDLPYKELIEKYNIIIKSFKDKRTNKFINLYLSNNAINSLELNNILPIFLD